MTKELTYQEALEKLKAKEQRRQQAIAMRRAGKTLQEIGDHFGLTRERIRQLIGNGAARQ